MARVLLRNLLFMQNATRNQTHNEEDCFIVARRFSKTKDFQQVFTTTTNAALRCGIAFRRCK